MICESLRNDLGWSVRVGTGICHGCLLDVVCLRLGVVVGHLSVIFSLSRMYPVSLSERSLMVLLCRDGVIDYSTRAMTP